MGGTSVTIQLSCRKGYLITHKYASEKFNLLKNHTQQKCGKKQQLKFILSLQGILISLLLTVIAHQHQGIEEGTRGLRLVINTSGIEERT